MIESIFNKINKIIANQNRRFDFEGIKSINEFIAFPSYIDCLFSMNEIESYVKTIKNFIDNNDKDCFNIWESYYLNIFARFEYLGGWESLSRTKKSLFFYLPLLNHITKWPYDLFIDRKVLKALLFKKDSTLFSLGDSNRKQLNLSNKNYFENIINYLNVKIRNSECLSLKYSEIENYKMCLSILGRENPMFDNLLNKILLQKMDFRCYNYVLFIAKIKLLMDIIYFRKFYLLERDEWKIA